MNKPTVAKRDWHRLSTTYVKSTFDVGNLVSLQKKMLINFGRILGFRTNKDLCDLRVDQFKLSVFKQGPLKGFPKYNLVGVDMTHQVSLTKDYVRENVFSIPVVPGSFGESISTYLKMCDPHGRFYYSPFT